MKVSMMLSRRSVTAKAAMSEPSRAKNACRAMDSGRDIGTETICAPTTSPWCQLNPLAEP